MKRQERSRNIINGLCDASVQLNGVLIPPSALDSVLGRYVHNLVAWNHDDVFRVSLLGSAIPLKYRGGTFSFAANIN